MAYPGFIGNTSLSFLSSIPGPPAPIPFSINLPYGIYSTNTWQHFFIERFSGNLYVGTDMRASNINTYQRITSFSNNLLTTTSSLFIGYPISSVGIGDTFRFNGAIANVSWLLGRAKYISTFGPSTSGAYVAPTRNISPNSTFTEVLVSANDSNTPFLDYSRRNRTTIPFSTLFSTINPFSNY